MLIKYLENQKNKIDNFFSKFGYLNSNLSINIYIIESIKALKFELSFISSKKIEFFWEKLLS